MSGPVGLSELVEAGARSGNPEIVAAAPGRLIDAADLAASAYGRGILALTTAFLSDGEIAEASFLEAIDWFRGVGSTLRPARAQLLYGEWLRRAGRRVDARAQLRAAEETFARAGASVFAERARRELVASCETARRRTVETRDDLTPQEAQIALFAADGQTNPEIGAQLFISPRTVEWHLRKVFRKLHVGSRRELRLALKDGRPGYAEWSAATWVATRRSDRCDGGRPQGFSRSTGFGAGLTAGASFTQGEMRCLSHRPRRSRPRPQAQTAASAPSGSTFRRPRSTSCAAGSPRRAGRARSWSPTGRRACSSATMQALARYWLDDYDFGRVEARLNALPQFVTEIDGVDIHFIHVTSSHENALPLIMTHGWPGSVIELLDSVGPLTDPTAHGGSAEDAFHLVLPSLPGYGLSGEPAEIGWDLGRTARAWAELMRRLGYTRYVAQGGDVGAGVTDAMGRQAPEGLIGIHTNLLVPALGGPMPTDTDEERAAAAQIATFGKSGNGYFVEMATRPQTIGYALLDSPVALAAWMVDHDTDAYYKIARAFVDGQPSGNLTRDNILDNITLYWLTGTGASAARSYWEAYGPDAPAASLQPLPAPTIPFGFTTFPGEIWKTPRSWVEASYPNVIYFNEVDKGGHFAAWEEPELFCGAPSGVQLTPLSGHSGEQGWSWRFHRRRGPSAPALLHRRARRQSGCLP